MAVPVALVARGVGGGDVSTAIATATPTPTATATTPPERDIYHRVMENRTPFGERLVVENTAQRRPMLMWFAKDGNGRALFCAIVRTRGGGGSGSCEGAGSDVASLPSDVMVTSPADPSFRYGTCRDDVTGVSGITADGGRIPGRVQRPAGAPRGIWTVSVPAETRVTSFEFTGAQGQVLGGVKEQPVAYPEAEARPVGAVERMPHGMTAGLVNTPDETVVWRLDGDMAGMHLVRPKDLLSGMDGGKSPVEMTERDGHWFGIADARTAKVELVFADRSTSAAVTRSDPWRIGFRLFSGLHKRSGDIYREGFEVVGYDAAGAEIWREPHPRETPAWP
ncbi:hypothetical protein [Sphaerisporangium fuscum]|uniref:hypothetical protein n=1 Tax=Sphaerisporangium fuscum TaxID=2835868 RepID=UPI001BDC944C|nr:hypothetical protein [Sphaerisporangium fuscum]